DVQRDAVETHPAADANADGGHLVIAERRRHPYADQPLAPLAGDAEAGEGADHPLFEGMDIFAEIRPPAAEIEHDIGHALSGAVIGVLAAASGGVDRK